MSALLPKCLVSVLRSPGLKIAGWDTYSNHVEYHEQLHSISKDLSVMVVHPFLPKRLNDTVARQESKELQDLCQLMPNVPVFYKDELE